MPWRKKWQPTPVFLPGKAHGQRSLVACRPWGLKRVRHSLVTKQQQRVTNFSFKIHGVRGGPTLKVRKGGGEEIPLVQGKEQRLRFAGAAVKRYSTPKVRETQVRR